jgi:SPOR domain
VSEIVVPSWRPSQEKPAVSVRMLAVAGGLLGVAALGAATVWGLSRLGPRPVPVIEADPRPLKVRPDQPGGMVVPNQDQLVLEGAAQRRLAERSRGTIAQLDTGPEAPAFDLLRQQAAPAAPPALAAPAPPPAAAATQAPTTAATPSALGTATMTALPPPVALAVTATVAAPAMVTAAALPGPVAGGRSHAQFGALNSEEAARAEWDRLVRRAPELAAFQPRIIRLDREGQPTLWRLRASGLADAAAAKALCDAVRARNIPCLPSGGGGGGNGA